jgi:2-polyprenyl-3-methyl-5-hydroxy-6-metoxy-1,4-benzoquinol methylase
LIWKLNLGKPQALDSTRDWDIEDQRHFWNEENARWILGKAGEAIGEESCRRGKKVIELLQKRLPVCSKVLDIGCANGWLCEWFVNYGWIPYGIDLSDASIEEAKKRVPKGKFFASSIFDAPSFESSFDAIVSMETITHVVDQAAFVKVVADTLSYGGTAVIVTQNRPIYSRRSNIKMPKNGQIRHWLTRKQLTTLMKPHFRELQVMTMEPSGDLGYMKIVQSYKLNKLLEIFLSKEKIKALKERLGFGQTLIAVAVK